MPLYNPSGGAPLNSPAFTGTPTAPSAAGTTDTTQIATTAMAQDAIDARLITADYQRGLGVIVVADDRTSGSMPALSARDIVIEY